MKIPDALLLATENKGKFAEISAIIRESIGNQITILSLLDLDEKIDLGDEIGSSFCEIAEAKARAAMNATGIASLGDDSWLCVDVLGGAPGIRSHRWVDVPDDQTRNSALLTALSRHPGEWAASFITCVALCIPDQTSITAQGELRGKIVPAPRGASGFGYDPIFQASGLGLTLAELSAAEKNRVSHRRNAIQNLLASAQWNVQ